MKSKFGWIWANLRSRFWFRVSIYAVGAGATVLLSEKLAPLMPDWLVDSVNDGASKELLKILASSMLVVATFSLGAMVQAYSAAASIATPRATRILIGDPKSQRVLSTFLGAFVFAMVGLLSQGFGYYNPAGEAVLLAATTLITVLVITTLLGWLDHLANLVRLGETICKVEARAREVLETRLDDPHMGGAAPDGSIETNWPVATEVTGYVQHLDVRRLQEIAAGAGGLIAVERIPGALADPVTPIAFLSRNVSDARPREDLCRVHFWSRAVVRPGPALLPCRSVRNRLARPFARNQRSRHGDQHHRRAAAPADRLGQGHWPQCRPQRPLPPR